MTTARTRMLETDQHFAAISFETVAEAEAFNLGIQAAAL